MKQYWLLLAFIVLLIFASCRHAKVKHGLPFGSVKGPRFTEVRRVFNTGLVFDKQGYQLEPSWQMYFISDDSVLVQSPKTKKYYGFHIYFDHDSVFNMVGAWLNLKKLTKDSIVFQALRVEEKIIKDDDEGSKVYMTFYSYPYIKSHDTSKIKLMSLPGAKDTAFIKAKAKLANSNIDSAFAARTPVILKSKSPLVKVEKVVSVSTPLNKIDPSIDYLYPEYNIIINKAYEGFDYSFSVFVDDKGQITFRKSTIPYPSEYKAKYEQIMKGIIDGYLKHYLDITPGNTLGIVHTSIILLNVTGKKD